MSSAGIFAISSFLAVAAACIVAVATGIAPGVWGRNAAAWVIGAALARGIARMRPALLCRAVLLVSPAALLLTLLDPGQSGVRRWIALGPLHWNAAFLCLPAATVSFAAAARSGWRWTWWAALVIELELCLQPDASQATAFAAAMVAILLTMRASGAARAALSLFFVLAAAIAWTRPDPLEPVPSVEGILALAGSVSAGLAALCVTGLAAVCASPLAALKSARPPAVALCVYFFVSTMMPLFGAFPVPLVGMGMSPIVGFWIGIGALIAVGDERDELAR